MNVAADQLATLLRNAVMQGRDDDVAPTSAVAIGVAPAFAVDVSRMLEAIRVAADHLATLLQNAVMQGDDDDVVPTSAVAVGHGPNFADEVPRKAIRR